MKRIVVGVDGSPDSLAALRWSGAVAAAMGGEVVAVHAYAPPWSEIRPEDLARLRNEQVQRVEGWCAPRLGDTSFVVEVADGDARDVLPVMAAKYDAQLLVVARTGSSKKGGGPGFLHLGSVAEYLAHQVDHPLAVVPPNADLPRSIAVAVDGSPHSASAVRWVAGLAEATSARVTAVAVEEPARPIAGVDEPDSDAALGVVAREWAAPLQSLGDRFSAVISHELPVADGILAAAAQRAADLVVLGARGLGGITGLRVGGVALGVLHRAGVAVVLVPLADES